MAQKKASGAPRRREDRRIRKTKIALREALTTLMAQKPIQNIRVRELAEMVDINRGTFYRYYRDIYDMLGKLEDELFEKFEALFEGKDTPTSVSEAKETLVSVFELMLENKDLVLALMGENGDPKFVERIRKMVRDRIVEDLIRVYDKDPDETFEYIYAFVVSGCTGMIQRWLSVGADETPEKMADIVEEIVARGLFPEDDGKLRTPMTDIDVIS